LVINCVSLVGKEDALVIHRSEDRPIRRPPAHRPYAFKFAAQGIVSALAKARDVAELDKIFLARIEGLAYQNAGIHGTPRVTHLIAADADRVHATERPT